MREEYDFSNAKPNPCARRLKRQVTVPLDARTVEHFQARAREVEIPYQTLIDLYLRECAATQKKLALHWKPAAWYCRTLRVLERP